MLVYLSADVYTKQLQTQTNDKLKRGCMQKTFTSLIETAKAAPIGCLGSIKDIAMPVTPKS